MARTAKIYCSPEELAAYAPKARLVESYEAFQLVELSPSALRETAERVPVEDITPLLKLTIGGKTVSTTKPRYGTRGETLAHPAYSRTEKLSPGAHHYIVQFVGPIKPQWLKAIKRAGGEYRGPYRDFAVLARLDEAARGRVAELPFVRWIGHLPHASRIAADVLQGEPRRSASERSTASHQANLGGGNASLPGMLVLQFFDKRDLAAAKPEIERCGAELVQVDSAAGVALVKVAPTGATRQRTIKKLAALHGVRLITKRAIPRKFNDVAPGFMGTTRAVSTASTGAGLTGDGELIAVADTGLDTGDPATVLSDFRGRVAAVHSWPIDPAFDIYVTNRRANDGAADVDSGHGTHVAGSAVGGGSTGPGGAARIRGLAHRARLLFQAIEQKLDFVSDEVAEEFDNEPFQLAGIPSNLTRLLKQAYDAGARIHSNSWGGGEFGDYDAQSRQLDDFIWKNKDFCVLVAAGNDGRDLAPSPDGIVDPGSVTPPGTAKNCITVGASESERAEFAGVTYVQFDRRLFSKNPTRTDPVANHRDHMAAFSSRGPTKDGRIKPDVVAPGTYILSTRSTRLPADEQGWAPYAANSRYFFMGGTSMATPLTAGAVGLLREWFRKRRNTPNPSAALLKASLICGAQRMPLAYVPGNPVFDHHQGFGRVHLDRVVAPSGGATFGFLDHAPGLQTGGQATQSVSVAAGRPLRVVLAYTDYPGFGLKNNLNLQLTAPDGTRRVGNATGNSLVFDTKNNVEVVELTPATAGTWRLQVIGANIPQGPQPFALVWLA